MKRNKIIYIALFAVLILSILMNLVIPSSNVFNLVFRIIGIIVSIAVLIVLLCIGVVFDMIGVAVTAASIEPFAAMRSRKVYGADKAMGLIKNAEKVSSICNDVVGDICGILTGAAGASIAARLLLDSMGDITKVLIVSSVSAIIAGLTIFGKACFKTVAMKRSTSIILKVGKFLKFFSFRRNKKVNKNDKNNKS